MKSELGWSHFNDFSHDTRPAGLPSASARAAPFCVCLKQKDAAEGTPWEQRAHQVLHPHPCPSLAQPHVPSSRCSSSTPQGWVGSPHVSPRDTFSLPSCHLLESDYGLLSFSWLGERRQRRRGDSKGCGIKPVAAGTSLVQSCHGALGHVPETRSNWGTAKLGYTRALPIHPWLMAFPGLLILRYF